MLFSLLYRLVAWYNDTKVPSLPLNRLKAIVKSLCVYIIIIKGEKMNFIEPPIVSVCSYLPDKFFHKSVNEPFIQKIMKKALGRANWTLGIVEKNEPDYFCNGVPFEFTIASDRRKKGNFVEKYRCGTYGSEDLEEDFFRYIRVSIERKLEKKYSVSNVHLCVLCVIDLTCWVFDEYGSFTYLVQDNARGTFFAWIKEHCITSQKFSNVFVIFPDMLAGWWVWDVLTNHKIRVQLSEEELLNRNNPFWIKKEAYEKVIKNDERLK